MAGQSERTTPKVTLVFQTTMYVEVDVDTYEITDVTVSLRPRWTGPATSADVNVEAHGDDTSRAIRDALAMMSADDWPSATYLFGLIP